MPDNDAHVSALIVQGDIRFSARRMTEALAYYQMALIARPNNAHVLHHLALASFHLDDLNQACAYAQRAVRAAPDHAGLWECAGLLAALKCDYGVAESFYRQALNLGGCTATLHRNLADSLSQSRRLVEAKEQYRQAILIEPNLHHAIRAVARISTDLGECDDAATYWLRAWSLDMSCLQDGLDLLSALAKVERTALLNDVITQIRTQQAGDADSLQAMCLALYKVDRFVDMLSVARQGLDIDPQCVMLHHYAAHAVSVCGNVAEALVHCREAV
jgi:tetratricopeptide (TPR) repeat protein